jgi:hypothetical protein
MDGIPDLRRDLVSHLLRCLLLNDSEEPPQLPPMRGSFILEDDLVGEWRLGIVVQVGLG